MTFIQHTTGEKVTVTMPGKRVVEWESASDSSEDEEPIQKRQKYFNAPNKDSVPAPQPSDDQKNTTASGNEAGTKEKTTNP
ncbi:hypothetical protein L596_000781 [Steinernema carpocapsae]|uniref:Uncharacterized protein n=1 Tax=Steinernema carpocapsae TaxID=34508 RepID=A0A4U8ULK3_STECR|nr:hypothetical protein L596_000781 [Steinernema carpocapsae]